MNFFEFMAKKMISKTSKRSNSQVSEYEMSDLAVCEGRWELVGKNEKCWYTIVSSQLFSTLFTSISGKEWMTGKRLFDYIRKQTLPDGTTGRVAFDEMGDRIYAEYQVVNVQSSSKEKRVVVGHYKYSNVSKITVIIR